MFEMTKNNHFVFGVNNQPFTMRTDYADLFFSAFGKCERQWQDFKTEGMIAAKEITQRAKLIGKKPLLFYSGGRDCEAMARMFIDSTDEKIDIFNIRYISEGKLINYYDQIDVDTFVSKNAHRINFHQEIVDIVQVLKSDAAKQLALKTNCKLIFMMPIAMAMIRKSNEGWVPVLGNADVLFLNEGGKWSYVELEYMMPWYYTVLNFNLTAVPGFFQWSPEFLMSFLSDEEVKLCCTGQLPGKINSRSTKYSFYKRVLDLRERFKSDGFEDLKNREDIVSINKELAKYVQYSTSHSAQRFSYEQLVTMLTEG
jgi:hypothetical protein